MTNTFEAVETVTAFVATFMVLSISFIGLSANISSATQNTAQIQEESYRAVAVTENMLTANSGRTPRTLRSGRSVLPSEFLADNTEVEGDHCFIPGVPGLDGDQFGYFIKNTGNDDPIQIGSFLPQECTQNPSTNNGSFSSPMIVKHPTASLESEVVVYAVS